MGIAAFLYGLLVGALAYHAWQVDKRRARTRRMRARLDEWTDTLPVSTGGDFWKARWPEACCATDRESCQCSTSVPADDNTTGCMDG